MIFLEFYGTIGPACAQLETLQRMVKAGMTGIRMNLSHGPLSAHKDWLDIIHAVGIPQLLIDLQGPELRIGTLPQPLVLEPGQSLRLGQGGVPCPAALVHAARPGQNLLLDDGRLLVQVAEADGAALQCTVVRGGTLQSRKSLAAPGLTVASPTLTEEDLQNLQLAGACGVTAQFRGRNIYANLMIFAMLFNGGLLPTFLLVKSYGLLNTVWALVLPGAVPIFNVILVMNFFAAVPKELEEAAFIDGANPLQVLTKIFIPISKPVLATVSLFSIVGSWNDFYSGLIYMSKAAYYPLMTYIQSLQINVEDLIKQGNLSAVVDSASLGNTNLNAAKIVVAVIPLLLIYPLLQRYFVSGIVVGSVKG